MEAALTGTSGMLSMYYLLSVFCARLLGVGSCRRGVGPRLGACHLLWAIRFLGQSKRGKINRFFFFFLKRKAELSDQSRSFIREEKLLLALEISTTPSSFFVFFNINSNTF